MRHSDLILKMMTITYIIGFLITATLFNSLYYLFDFKNIRLCELWFGTSVLAVPIGSFALVLYNSIIMFIHTKIKEEIDKDEKKKKW